MGFAQHIDYPLGNSTVGAAGYTAGSGSLALTTGGGGQFPSPSPGNPVRITVSSAASPSTCTSYYCAGKSGDTLTGLVVLNGNQTDRNYVSGDNVFSSVYAEDLNDLQNAGYLTANQTITLSGDASGSGTTALTATLATVNPDVGTYQGLTVNAKGLVTAATNESYLTGNQAITLAGDAGGSGATAITVTLATVNSNAGSFGSSIAIPTLTVNGKGLITAASTNAVVAPAGTLSGTTLNSTVVTSSLTTVGTIGTGTWQGTIIAGAYGGTGINNGSSTITIGGDVAFSGAYSFAATLTGTTSVTFPTSGTLSTTTGTVMTASVVTAHGFAGTVATATTTPAITLTTTITGILKGDGTSISAAVSDTDYQAPISLTTTGSSGAATFSGNVLNVPQYSGGGGSPGGSSGQVQYNSSSSFGGAADITVGAQGQLNLAAITPSTQVAGDVWFDATQLCHVHYGGSGTSADCVNAYRIGLIYAQTANVTSPSAPSAASLVSTSGAVGSVAWPANYLSVAGRTIEIDAGGYYNTGSSSGSVTLAILLGGNVVATSLSYNFGPSKTNAPWALKATTTVKVAGASGKIDTIGTVSQVSNSASTLPLIANGTTAGTQAPQTQVGVTLTNALTFDLQVTSAGTGNTITLTNLTIKGLAEMAQNLIPKEQNFVSRYGAAVQALIAAMNALILLDTEFVDMTYGTGGANAIADSTVQLVYPAATAAQFNSAEGAVVNIISTYNSNLGYLLWLVP